MNKNIYEFLKELKFDDGEIETLLNAAPVLGEVSFEQALSNMTAIVSMHNNSDIRSSAQRNNGYAFSRGGYKKIRAACRLSMPFVRACRTCLELYIRGGR